MTLKKKYEIKEDGDVVFIQEMTHTEHQELLRVQDYLHKHDFKYHGNQENEGLYATGAWRRTENLLIILADAEPFDDKINGLVHPDPFNAPTNFNNDVWVLVYVNPKWEYDDDQENIPDPGNCDAVLEMITQNLGYAIELVKSLIKLLPVKLD